MDPPAHSAGFGSFGPAVSLRAPAPAWLMARGYPEFCVTWAQASPTRLQGHTKKESPRTGVGVRKLNHHRRGTSLQLYLIHQVQPPPRERGPHSM